MKIQNSLFLTFILLTMVSCLRSEKNSEIRPGITSVNEIFESFDEPNEVHPAMQRNQEIFVYDDLSIQIDQAKVKAVYRKPASIQEKNLQYWRHLYKAFEPSFTEVKGTQKTLMQLKYKRPGINIIYDKNIDEVVRIIEYDVL